MIVKREQIVLTDFSFSFIYHIRTDIVKPDFHTIINKCFKRRPNSVLLNEVIGGFASLLKKHLDNRETSFRF